MEIAVVVIIGIILIAAAVVTPLAIDYGWFSGEPERSESYRDSEAIAAVQSHLL